MKITVVISNYNYVQYLGLCVKSCLNQDTPFQLIIVDDASTDDSWEYIKEIANTAKQKNRPVLGVRLIKNSQGNARGKNIGIALSKTEYITCLDADDMLMPNSLTTRLTYLGQHPVKWVHGRAVRITGDLDLNSVLEKANHYQSITSKRCVERMDELYHQRAHDEISHRLDLYRGIEASTVLMHRSLYEQYGIYDENMKWKIDREMWHRLLSHRVKKGFIDEWVSIYRQHPKQATKNIDIKNPFTVDRIFKKTIRIRQKVSEQNTLFLKNYNHKRFIQETSGVLL